MHTRNNKLIFLLLRLAYRFHCCSTDQQHALLRSSLKSNGNFHKLFTATYADSTHCTPARARENNISRSGIFAHTEGRSRRRKFTRYEIIRTLITCKNSLLYLRRQLERECYTSPGNDAKGESKTTHMSITYPPLHGLSISIIRNSLNTEKINFDERLSISFYVQIEFDFRRIARRCEKMASDAPLFVLCPLYTLC